MINYNQKIDLIGTINNEIIIFINNNGNMIIIVDIKYLAIVQFINNSSNYLNMRIKDNFLLTLSLKTDNKLIILKKTFDLKEKCFNKDEIIEKESKLSHLSNVLITDSDYIVILNYNYMTLLNL